MPNTSPVRGLDRMKQKFIGQIVIVEHNGTRQRGVVNDVRAVRSGRFNLAVQKFANSLTVWVNSRRCKITHC